MQSDKREESRQSCKRLPSDDMNTCKAYKKGSSSYRDYSCCKYAVDGSLLCEVDGCSAATSPPPTQLPSWGCKK